MSSSSTCPPPPAQLPAAFTLHCLYRQKKTDQNYCKYTPRFKKKKEVGELKRRLGGGQRSEVTCLLRLLKEPDNV